MLRPSIMCVLYAALLSASAHSTPDVAVEKNQTELTEKQKEAWQAKRKEVADYPYMVVGYDSSAKEWMTCVYVDPKLIRYEFKRKAVDLWIKDERPSATELAKQKADTTNITATAVVDLVGSEEPKALRWFFKQGKVTKSSESSPQPELAKSLKAYLLFIQTNPQLVKIPDE